MASPFKPVWKKGENTFPEDCSWIFIDQPPKRPGPLQAPQTTTALKPSNLSGFIYCYKNRLLSATVIHIKIRIWCHCIHSFTFRMGERLLLSMKFPNFFDMLCSFLGIFSKIGGPCPVSQNIHKISLGIDFSKKKLRKKKNKQTNNSSTAYENYHKNSIYCNSWIGDRKCACALTLTM